MRCGRAAALRPPIHKAAVPISESSTSSVDSDMAGTGCVSQKACVTCSWLRRACPIRTLGAGEVDERERAREPILTVVAVQLHAH